MFLPPSSDHRAPPAASRGPLLAAMLAPGWAAGTRLPAFLDVAHDLPLGDGGPGLWTAAAALPGSGAWQLAGLAMALAIGVAAALLAHFAVRPPPRGRSAAAALLAALALPWLLPATASVDFAPALLLALADAVQRRNGANAGWVLAGLATAAAGLPVLGALAVGIAIWRTTRLVIVLPANDNVLPLGPCRLYPAGSVA